MLGLFLLYFIGKSYYKLAEEFEKSKWGFAVIGVISYYAGTFIAGILLALAYMFLTDSFLEEDNDLALSLIAIPFGLLACWAVYTFLKKRWERELEHPFPMQTDVLDDEFLK